MEKENLRMKEERKIVDERIGRERIEMIEKKKIEIVDEEIIELLVKVVIEIERKEKEEEDIGIIMEIDEFIIVVKRIVKKKEVERGLERKIGKSRDWEIVEKKRIRSNNDERIEEVEINMEKKNVEVVGRSSEVWKMNIVLRKKMEIKLKKRRGVLRKMKLKKMRKKEEEKRNKKKIELERRDEMVKKEMRKIGEVKKMGLKKKKRERVRKRIEVLVEEEGLLRENRIDGLVDRM